MKSNFISFILISYFSLLYSQTNDSLLNYYPLQVGNKWEFKFEQKLSHPAFQDYDKLSIEVIGDSILPNGIKYSVLQKKYTPEVISPEVYFDRIDTSTLNVYRYNNQYIYPVPYIDEFLIDSLKANIGDVLNRNYLCRITNMPGSCTYDALSQDSILGNWTSIKNYISGTILEIESHYWLAKGIGLARMTIVDLNGIDTLYTWKLSFAKIAEKEYGLQMNITKSDNRKVDSFILHNNYPNPFNFNTDVNYELCDITPVEINIYNERGQKIMSDCCGIQRAGIYKKALYFKNMNSGLYFIELKTNKDVQRIKCILIK